ncbi:MAG: CPBP family intramembrane metalloprotease, partial [Flavobacteriales bacterium]|nr:CPBP family intramembrane metalloprotease [Flavobacteriales bacterium]
FFRGFLFKGLENSFLGGHGAVFISSFLFAAIHLQYDQTIMLFILLPMAILLGYSRLMSKSLVLPILLHSINNLAACLFTHFEIY